MFLVVLLVSAAVIAQDSARSPPLLPPGRLVDVGGWRLHVNYSGEIRATQPTVILESGAGDAQTIRDAVSAAQGQK